MRFSSFAAPLACTSSAIGALAAAAVAITAANSVVIDKKRLSQPPAGVAVYYDAENMPADLFTAALERARAIGEVRSVRIYAPKRVLLAEKWEAVIPEGAERAVCVGAAAGKNSVDIRIVVDVMEDTSAGLYADYVIVSSDSDYAPLAEEVRSRGARIHGIGRDGVSSPRVSGAYDTWCQLQLPTKEKHPKKRSEHISKQPELPPETVRALEKAVEAVHRTDGWSLIASVGNYLAATQGPSYSDLGFSTLEDLLRAAKVFEIRKPKQGRPRVKHR